MSGGGIERGDVRANQEGFGIAQVDVSLGQLRSTGAHRFDFPALEDEAGFEPLFDEIVKSRPAVFRNQPLWCVGFRHRGIVPVILSRPAQYPRLHP